MKTQPEKLYLDLMKKTISFFLWPEPPTPIEFLATARSPVKRLIISIVSKSLGIMNLKLAREKKISSEERINGQISPVYAHTMIGLKRLDNLQYCIETVINEKIEGDLIETGVCRGGACIFMRAVLAAYGVEERKVFAADSFEGLPKPDIGKHPVDKGDKFHAYEWFKVSQKEVEENFRKYGLLDDKVIFLKGWFKDTLPSAPIAKLSILRLDGDMYGSTMDSLENLYSRLSKGGFCIIDDYALAGCRAAVDDYRKQHKIGAKMHEVDWSGRYWRKE